jgi:Abortive infection alpha
MVDVPGRKEIVAGVRMVLGPSGRELGEMVADRLRFWRWRQAVKIMERAAEIKKAKKRQQVDVPLKFFLPFVEESSKEDNDDLAEFWATLLATAGDKTTGFDLLCIDILKKMGRDEARLLLTLEEASRTAPTLTGSVSTKFGEIARDLFPSEEKWNGRIIARLETKLLKTKIFPVTLTCPVDYVTRVQQSRFYSKNARTILAIEKLGLVDERNAEPFGYRRVSIKYLVLSELGSEVIGRCLGR